MTEAAFWITLALIALAAIGLLFAALARFEQDGFEPIEHDVDEP